tara:strand:+ start:118 stop:366 length:249 start_codon:yes stop_codon:yes gene_type:complete
MSSIEDINSLIGSLSAEQIKAIMTKVASKKRTSVDTSRKARRIALTKLYFDNAPRPKDSFEDYLNHSDGIREQIISGVEAWK